MNLGFIFLTGLTSGGLACLAVQGGLLASVIANQKDQEKTDILDEVLPAASHQKKLKILSHHNFSISTFDDLDWLPVSMFLIAKLFAHLVLGLLLGTLGSVITLSLGVRLFFQAFTALFMFSTAMNLLDVHPIFRFVAFQPPKFIQHLVKNTSRSKALFAPLVLGLMTIFIPCGITQAMEVLAVNSGSAVQGALIMGAFVLGTVPIFAILGIATAKLSEGWYQRFNIFAAYSLIVMALYSLNGVLVVTNSPLTFQKITRPITNFFSGERFQHNTTQVKNNRQQVLMNITNNGYSPRSFTVKKGIPVDLILLTKDTYSCAASFVFPEFNIKVNLSPNDQQTVSFTPTRVGKYSYSCSMGMYTGVMEVVE